MASPVEISWTGGGAVLEIALAQPPRNVIDRAMATAIAAAVAAPPPRTKAILLRAEGPSFSVGASVAEHGRAQVAAMLGTFHAAIHALFAPDLPIVAAVRGHCLGGGLELALCATRIVAAPDARLGQPEIKLGAIAPVGSLLLPRRVGAARAEAMLLSGEILDAPAARAIGLVDEVADDPDAAARAWIAQALLPHSASSLRIACEAARLDTVRALYDQLPKLELLYTEELATTHDAEEGVRAFVEKRPPRWEDR